MDPQLPAQLVQLLAPSLRRRVKALPPHSWREHRDSRQRMHEALPPFVYSFPIR